MNAAAPFAWGGAEELAANLVRRLDARAGVSAELMRLPYAWNPPEQLVAEIMAHRLMRITNTDRVIALKFPAYLIPHPDKTLWVLHQFRQAYDLLESGHSHLDAARDGGLIEAIRRADARAFADARAIFCNSPVTRDRMACHNGVTPEVLYPPLNDPELFTGGRDEGYVFAGGRVARGKRQHLLVEAAALAGPGCRLVVAGPPEDEVYAAELRALVEHHGVGDRVILELRLLDRAEIAALVNGARACAYVPFDEDSLGYVTMEAFASGKPVVTTTDSGGLLEIVHDGETGLVVEPEADALAAALRRLTSDAALARGMGLAAAEAWTRRNLTWDATLDRLLG